MRILFIADVFGSPGRRALHEGLPGVLKAHRPDAVVVNGENAAGGNGLTRPVYDEILSAGADLVTLGNHTWDKKDILAFIDEEPALIRPANYPPGTPGRGLASTEVGGERLVVISVMGRIFATAQLDDPFRIVDGLLETECRPGDVILVDVHAEATSEKRALAVHLTGRVAAVVGTHTHVQTADLQILEGRTAFMTDVGMTGPKDSVIGVKKELVLEKFLTQRPVRFETAPGPWQLEAVLIETEGGRPKEAVRIHVDEQAGG